ncbi:MAG: hypothetical protein E6R03_05255 [Hyphomicrobiaceae bacterium]|nr:MAG: hypothetical protein E6R03_05255 [Hyphomicrobiaceae bacterium]
MFNYVKNDALCCGKCGGSYTHTYSVEVWNRNEDAEKGTHVVVEGPRVIIDNDLSGNPSKRRHAVAISLWCEQCWHTSTLTLAQHKGATVMDFEDIRPMSRDEIEAAAQLNNNPNGMLRSPR